ncbi:hypothetical protein [Clostridium sp.]|uniref:IS66 family insertion sequence element accessory protein TnpA n=1 Tax=Clostridium sp. TaxID=1506 RepID=UPI002620BD4F|nr:hypothetical protein [Clostridium sp.]
MARSIGKAAWKEYIDKFSSYEGSLTQYCAQNSISKSQFYYNRRLFTAATKDETKFQAVSLNEEDKNITSVVRPSLSADIRIEIGKFNIFIPANEIDTLSSLIKEIAK